MERLIFEEEHELFRESFRRFLADEVVPHHDAWEHAKQVDRDLYTKAGKLGFLGIDVPEGFGGGSVADFRYNQIMVEEIQYAGVSSSGLGLSLHNDICVPTSCTSPPRSRNDAGSPASARVSSSPRSR